MSEAKDGQSVKQIADTLRAMLNREPPFYFSGWELREAPARAVLAALDQREEFVRVLRAALENERGWSEDARRLVGDSHE